MSDFIWGLTTKNIENAFWNGVSQTALSIGVVIAAAAANSIASQLINNNSEQSSSRMKPLLCTVIGAGAGIYVTYHFAETLPYVTIAADKALKFATISIVTGMFGLKSGWVGGVIALITSGGAFGYFGRNALRWEGIAVAVATSLVVSAGAARTQES